MIYITIIIFLLFFFSVFFFSSPLSLRPMLPVAYTEQVKYAAGTRPFGQPLELPSHIPDEDEQQVDNQLGRRRSLMAGAVMAAKKNLTFKK